MRSLPHIARSSAPIISHYYPVQAAIDWWAHMGEAITYSPTDTTAQCIEHADIILNLCGRLIYSSFTLQDSSRNYIQRVRSALKADAICCRAGILPLFYTIPLGTDGLDEHLVLTRAVMDAMVTQYGKNHI